MEVQLCDDPSCGVVLEKYQMVAPFRLDVYRAGQVALNGCCHELVPLIRGDFADKDHIRTQHQLNWHHLHLPFARCGLPDQIIQKILRVRLNNV